MGFITEEDLIHLLETAEDNSDWITYSVMEDFTALCESDTQAGDQVAEGFKAIIKILRRLQNSRSGVYKALYFREGGGRPEPGLLHDSLATMVNFFVEGLFQEKLVEPSSYGSTEEELKPLLVEALMFDIQREVDQKYK